MKLSNFISVALLLLTAIGYVTAQTPVYNIDEAKTQVEGQDKTLLMVFSGSDWCKPCIKLKKEVLQSSDFKSYWDQHLVLLELDFPYKKKNRLNKDQTKHNEVLADKYNTEGVFPLVLLFPQSEKPIPIYHKPGATTAEFIDQISKRL